MSKEIKNEPAKVDKQEIAEVKLSESDLQQMYGDIGQEDVTIPRLIILQGLSPEVTEGKGSPGQFYIKGFERNLGKEPVECIVLMRSKSRMRWRDLKLGGGILCSSPDGKIGKGDPGGECEKCEFSAWQPSDDGKPDKPGCDVYQNIILVLRKDTEWMPLALSGNRTKLKALKSLNSLLMMEMSKGRPMFAKSYMLESIQRQNAQGMAYFNYRIIPGNNNAVIPAEEQQKAYQIFASLRGKAINIQEESPNEQVAPETTAF